MGIGGIFLPDSRARRMLAQKSAPTLESNPFHKLDSHTRTCAHVRTAAAISHSSCFLLPEVLHFRASLNLQHGASGASQWQMLLLRSNLAPFGSLSGNSRPHLVAHSHVT